MWKRLAKFIPIALILSLMCFTVAAVFAMKAYDTLYLAKEVYMVETLIDSNVDSATIINVIGRNSQLDRKPTLDRAVTYHKLLNIDYSNGGEEAVHTILGETSDKVQEYLTYSERLAIPILLFSGISMLGMLLNIRNKYKKFKLERGLMD